MKTKAILAVFGILILAGVSFAFDENSYCTPNSNCTFVFEVRDFYNQSKVYTGQICNFTLYDYAGAFMLNEPMENLSNGMQKFVLNSTEYSLPNGLYYWRIRCESNGFVGVKMGKVYISNSLQDRLFEINQTVASTENKINQIQSNQTAYFPKWNATFYYWNDTYFANWNGNIVSLDENWNKLWNYWDCGENNNEVCSYLLDIKALANQIDSTTTGTKNIVEEIKTEQDQQNETLNQINSTVNEINSNTQDINCSSSGSSVVMNTTPPAGPINVYQETTLEVHDKNCTIDIFDTNGNLLKTGTMTEVGNFSTVSISSLGLSKGQTYLSVAVCSDNGNKTTYDTSFNIVDIQSSSSSTSVSSSIVWLVLVIILFLLLGKI